jgi:hypothetical protein
LILRAVGQVVLLWTTAALAKLREAWVVVPGAQQF